MRFLPLLLLLFPAPASAGIIGLLWSHARSNVTVRGELINGRESIRVTIPKHNGCPLQFHRRDPKELDARGTETRPGKDGKPGTPVLPLALWQDRACFDKNSKEPTYEHIFDLERDVFGLPALAKHRAAFLNGEIELAICLQESAPGAPDQSLVCGQASLKEIQAGKTLYASTFQLPPDKDLGLTEPRLADAPKRFKEVGSRPRVEPGQSIAKWPTLTAVVEPFVLPLSAGVRWQHSDERRYEYYIVGGRVVDEATAKEAARRDAVVCSAQVSQPQALWEKETEFSYPGGRVTVSGGSGSALFYRDQELEKKRYWSEHITVFGYGDRPKDRSVLLTLSCATPNGNWNDTTGVTVGQLQDGLTLDGVQLLKLYSDYPGYQQP